MIIGLVTAQLSLPEARSLKDKRAVIRSLKDRIRQQVNVSVAETGAQDKWQRAEMAFVTVAAESRVVQERIAEVAQRLRSDPRWVLLDYSTEML